MRTHFQSRFQNYPNLLIFGYCFYKFKRQTQHCNFIKDTPLDIMTSFQQPVGPQADLAELEYITTLHQTSFPELRKDCSISSADISLFLRSRYGLKIHQDRAIDIVLGLGGNTSKKEMSSVRDLDEEHTNIVQNKKSESDEKELNNRHNSSLTNSPEGSDEVHLDLVQALSVILIPTFIKASQDSLEETRKLSSEVVRVRREIAASENTCSFLDCIENLWTQRHLRLKRELRFLRERQSLLVDPYLLETVRRALISSIQESQTQTVTLDCHFVESLLRAYGEDECADDPELVAQMVECATVSGKPGRGISTFDVEVFSAALTSDIQSWEKGIEDRLSTPFFDVHGFDPISHTTLRSSGIEQVTNTSMIESQEVFEGQTRDEVRHNSDTEEIGWWPVDKLLPTGPSIDSVIDTHQSILFLMANWAYFIFSVTVYMTFINATNYDIFHCGQKYNCILINRIWTWFSLGFLLTFGGMIIMMPISLANDPYKFPWYNALISAMTLIVFTLGPYVFIESYKRSIPHGDQGQLTDLDRIVEAGWFRLAIDIYLAYGLILLIFIPKQLISHNCGQEDKESLGIIGRGFLSSDLLRSAGTKKSATRKIHILLKNAASLHTQSEGLDRGHQSIMSRYIKHEDSHKAVGGILWSFVMLLSNRLLEEHGVWVHSSLAVAQEGQILSFIFLIVVLVYETEAFAAYCDATITEIEDSQPGPIRDLVLWYIPRGDIVRKSSSVGILFAIAVGIVLILVYLPSTVSTVLQLRCGELPTMNDKHFTRKYRYSADTTYYNLGKLF